MKILLITGSPHKNGTSALLADRFAEGARSARHEIIRFDAAFQEVHPCHACEYCITHDHRCVYKDAMEKLNPELLSADLVALVTPVYYFGMSAQIKCVIDRFFAKNSLLREHSKKSVLLATCGDTESWVADALVSTYQAMCRYLHWQDCGILTALGVYHREDIEKTDYPQKARELGASL